MRMKTVLRSSGVSCEPLGFIREEMDERKDRDGRKIVK
jgi:hypothetical protein